ncbi:meiotic nuclear division protein 1 homolog [Culicoides brevitarsis]|uniref:meiotic nuclear division protein 1 homolog n=1 Tax=Culicoides brevitarsis TaxID=469753 RepID=UPI00307BEF4A
MSKRKLTSDDKKSLLLDFFHEKCEVFQLKELEKVAPRTTGIASQGIKDILQKLLDDGLVDTAKIGSSVFYWSYPNKSKTEKITKLQELQKQLTSLEAQVAKLQQEQSLREAEIAKEADENAEIHEIEQKNAELKEKYQKLLDELGPDDPNDKPETWIKMKKDAKNIYDAANRWTDNVFAIKSWCKKKFNCEDAIIDKQFRIPQDFDYLE